MANDKAATFAVLSHFNIPAIEHVVFSNPGRGREVKALLRDLQAYFEKHNCDIVLKPNKDSSGGFLVEMCKGKDGIFALQDAAKSIWDRGADVAARYSDVTLLLLTV